MDDPRSGPSPETRLVQGDHHVDPASGAIVPALQPSTTFARDETGTLVGPYGYARDRNPTCEAVERAVTRLEGGADALAFASGLAGVAAALETVPAGARVAAPRLMYHGTLEWLRRLAARRAIDLALFDARDADGLERALAGAPADLVWIETPANPTWDVVDIARAATAAHAAGAVLAVDSTAATPVTTRPFEHGADLVFHSATKYLNGHSDVTAGVLVTRAVDARWEEARRVRTLSGGVLGPFEAWLLLRGMRTLFVRFERASANALAIARRLDGHPRLEAVLYPGLPGHPGHATACRQMTAGFGGMLSLLLAGGEAGARAFASRLRVFVRATSLGGVESLAEHRALVEPPGSLVPRNLVRLSVGIERLDDLLTDLEQALG